MAWTVLLLSDQAGDVRDVLRAFPIAPYRLVTLPLKGTSPQDLIEIHPEVLLLDGTYKEFELLKFLSQRPGRVCDRDLLLREVWGYDYYGGTRTVDVHIRRLRAKLGPEHEALIETIRNVGYRLVPRPRER